MPERTAGSADRVNDIWDRLARMMHRLFPGAVLGSLNPPATLAQIEAAERAMNVRLPDDVRAAYINFNGVNHRERLMHTRPLAPTLIVPFYDWCDLDHMVWRWKVDREVERGCPQILPEPELVDPHDKVQYVLFDSRRIPIGDIKMETTAYIDLAPGGGGTYGQLIKVDGGKIEPIVLATSFTAYFEKFVHLVESNLICYDDDKEGWCDRASGEWLLNLDNF